ncbi:hypothetical protein [Zhihengliuella halotolerans]|uniref:hypothetical protein n=1 Tax=Zhihengliuella halotolerans TaxID=370736 RepID=UPI000C7F9F43|nr:hypothetical protein [Zhihengliuella halotolerans]
MKTNHSDGIPVALVLLVLVTVLLYLTAVPEQPVWWIVVAGIAVVGCAWGAVADSIAKSKQLRRDHVPR